MSLAVATAPAVLNASHPGATVAGRGSSAAQKPSPKAGNSCSAPTTSAKVADAIMPYLAALIDETSQLGIHIADDKHL